MATTDECGCTESNCPHRTSEVTLFDGQFTNITVPAGSSLNDVLALLENYITSASSCNDVNYTLTAFSACLNLSAGTYSFTQIIDAIVAQMCANTANITALTNQVNSLLALTTTNVTLDGIVLPSCFSAFTGTTSTELFNTILSSLCDLLNEVAPVIDDPITITPPDPSTQIDPSGTSGSNKSSNGRIEHVAEAIKSISDNDSFIYEHTAPITSPTSFVVDVQAMRGVVENYLVLRKITEELTVNASKDTYFYLSIDSSILRREVANGAPAPATPTSSHELYTIVSDGSGVTLVTNTFTSTALNPIPLGTDDVTTVTIKDANVTTAKLAPVNVGSTQGHVALIQVRNNDEGQVDSLTSNLSLAGISNGQIMVYNAGLNRFENADNWVIPTANAFPKSNAAGTDFEDSSIKEVTNQIEITKKVEINTGAPADVTQAGLNIETGTFMVARYTAAAAASLSTLDGTIIYVTSTDATFTSIGFWGVEATVWVKL